MSCDDCGRQYGAEHGFPDLVIPYDAWKEISPSGDDGGLLCPSCICKRLHDKGIRCTGAFMSGPIISVSEPTMSALRRIENIELAIQGRDNAWNGARSMAAPGPGYHAFESSTHKESICGRCGMDEASPNHAYHRKYCDPAATHTPGEYCGDASFCDCRRNAEKAALSRRQE